MSEYAKKEYYQQKFSLNISEKEKEILEKRINSEITEEEKREINRLIKKCIEANKIDPLIFYTNINGTNIRDSNINRIYDFILNSINQNEELIISALTNIHEALTIIRTRRKSKSNRPIYI